jgi:hypothetical protein
MHIAHLAASARWQPTIDKRPGNQDSGITP